MLRMARRLFLAALAALFGNVAAISAADAERYWVYIGTYTSKDGSKGINRCQLDVKTGKLSEPEVAAAVGSPSFVNFSPDGKFLYAVGESAGKNGGGVYAYSVDAVTGKLTKLNERGSVGADCRDLSVLAPLCCMKLTVSLRLPSSLTANEVVLPPP